MITERQKEKARIFSTMHKEDKMFVLPNAWDAGSAYIFEKQGFQAVATSSAGMAYDLGYPDGENICFDDLLYAVRKIAKRIDIPLSVDFERGYGKTVCEVKENAKKLIVAGAVGFNIEDGLPDGTLNPLDQKLDKIKGLCQLKQELDIDFVINARTCAYWLNVAGEEEKLQMAIERGNAFAEAGADCVFVPGAMDKTTVEKLTAGIKAPINIILNGVFHDYAQLEELGVRRLSLGSGPVRYIYGQTISLANHLYNGEIDEMLNSPFVYAEANAYFKK